MPEARPSWHARVMLAAFQVLYTNTALYWLASTIPFAGQWRTWQRLVLPRLRGHDVLELGCGPGWLLADMAAAGYRCRAIDASPQMVAGARRTLARRGLAGADVVVAQGKAQALPFADAAFDVVVSTFPAPYIGDLATLREVARVLRPGGQIIIVMGAQLTPGALWRTLLAGVARLVYGRATVPEAGPALRNALPLATVGIAAQAEIVSGPTWRAYIIIGTRGHDAT